MIRAFCVAFLFCAWVCADQQTYNVLVSLLAQQKVTGELSPRFSVVLATYEYDYQEPNDGYSLLMVACAEGHNDVVATLLTMGANPNCAMHWGNTALHEAVENGNIEAARILLRKGARVDALTKDGHSPWHLGEIYNHRNMVAILRREFAAVDRYLNSAQNISDDR